MRSTTDPKLSGYELNLWELYSIAAVEAKADSDAHPHKVAERAASIADALILERRVRAEDGIPS